MRSGCVAAVVMNVLSWSVVIRNRRGGRMRSLRQPRGNARRVCGETAVWVERAHALVQRRQRAVDGRDDTAIGAPVRQLALAVQRQTEVVAENQEIRIGQ